MYINISITPQTHTIPSFPQGQHPTPDVEIAFWKQRAAALNAIHDQLQSPRVRKASGGIGSGDDGHEMMDYFILYLYHSITHT